MGVDVAVRTRSSDRVVALKRGMITPALATGILFGLAPGGPMAIVLTLEASDRVLLYTFECNRRVFELASPFEKVIGKVFGA